MQSGIKKKVDPIFIYLFIIIICGGGGGGACCAPSGSATGVNTVHAMWSHHLEYRSVGGGGGMLQFSILCWIEQCKV